MERDGAAVGRAELTSGAHVVLDIAAAEDAARVDILETSEDFGGRAADGVGHYVQAAAMAHSKDCRVDAEGRAECEHCIEERDQDGEALERKALGAEVARLDDLLEEVGADEVGEDVCLVGRGRRLLHLLL